MEQETAERQVYAQDHPHKGWHQTGSACIRNYKETSWLVKERKKERKKERMTLCVLTSLAAVLNEKGVREKPKGW